MEAAAGKEYDITVIGAGYGGLIAALNARRAGLEVCAVEKRGKVGGTCLYEGCIPSKALLNSSQKFYEAKHVMQKHGVKCTGVEHDFEAMMKKKEDLLNLMGHNNTKKFKDLGIDLFTGSGYVRSANEVEVRNEGEAPLVIKTKNILLSMGGEPAPLPGNAIPVDGVRVIQSTQALSLKKRPDSMVVVGGGFIGLELGSHYTRLGTDVTIVEFLDRVIAPFDGDCSRGIKDILENQGVKFQLGSKVIGGKVLEDKVVVHIEDAKGGNLRDIEAEIVLVATGRRVCTKDIGLEQVGVKLDRFGRIEVNEKLQSSIPNIYAVGDVSNRGPALAHKAEDEALAFIDQFLGKKTHLNYDNIPAVCYTHPEVCAVGKTEEQLIAEGVEYKKGVCPFTANSRAKCNDETEGFIKFLACKKTNKILGIHMIGAVVGEMVQEGVLCLEYGTTLDLIARTSHSHPGFGEAFKDAAITCFKAN